MNARQQFGRAAEAAAARYLVRDGWTLLGRNVRIGRGELDLIARRGAVLAFVEVKARRTDRLRRARGRRRRGASGARWPGWPSCGSACGPWALRGVSDVRFDIVAVDAAVRPPVVRHLPGAFTLDG